MQIIVSSELNPKAHGWLTALTDQLSTMTANQLICNIRSLTEKDEREYADSVLSVVFKANTALLNQYNKEAANVYEVLMELLKPKIDEKIDEAVNTAVSTAVDETTLSLDAKHIVQSVDGIMNKLGVSFDSACEAIDCTPEDYDRAQKYLSSKTE